MAFAVQTPSASTSEPYRYEEKADFTGGLNFRADQFNLLANESPAMLNVEVDPRGGVRRRDAVTKVNATALADEIISLFTHYEAGQNQILASVNPSTALSTTQMYWNENASGNFAGPMARNDGTLAFSGSQPATGVTFNGYTYIVNGSMLASPHSTGSAIQWHGSNALPGSYPRSFPVRPLHGCVGAACMGCVHVGNNRWVENEPDPVVEGRRRRKLDCHRLYRY